RIRSVQLGDADGDGEFEVLVGTLDGHMCALNRTAETIKWQHILDDRIQSIYTAPSVSQDSTELILGSEGKRIYIYGDHYHLVAEPIVTPEGIRIVTTYDLNADGIQEIIAGGVEGYVYTYTYDGQLQWTFWTGHCVRAVCVQDIDNDGRVEIILGSEDRNVYVLNEQGALKWCYYTPHRVLDIDAVDIDGDGQVEVLIGGGDGFVYVLNGSGDSLWRYQANDRIRVVRAADMDNDGVVEIVVGSEDQLYLLRTIDRRQHQEYLALCRQKLLTGRSHQELIYALSLEADPDLRSFALIELATYPELTESDFERFRHLFMDSSYEVRTTFARVIVSIYKANPICARGYLDPLSSDRENDVRLAFISSLPALALQNPQIGFEYLDRFTRNTRKLIRRTVVRKLDQLTPMFPQQVFKLLLNSIRDYSEWIRQESARVLAHYFDVHTAMLLTGTRLLMTKGVDRSLCELIMRCARTLIVQKIFSAVAGLLSDLTEDTILTRLKDTVEALEQTRALAYGESMWEMHYEFYRLHCICTVGEIAGYRCSLKMMPTGDETHFTDTLQVLHGLNEPVTVLKTYLRREGLGDRLASLLEATHAIEALMADIECSYFKWCGQQQFPDLSILRLLLTRWHAIVLAEIARLRGKAELRAELQTQRVRQETQVTVWLRIHNGGRSPADNVMVTLMPSDAFIVVGVSKQQFVTISTRDAVRVEFTVRPLKPSLRLCFEIVYDDAEHRGKEMQFADLLELVVMEQEFRPIPNPYIAGQPIRDSNMFYGRDEELKFLQENLTRLSTNTVIVLYGQRRSGKSSLLYQLRNTSLLSPHVPVYIDMQGLMLSNSTSRLLFKVARTIHQDLQEQGVIVVPPQLAPFEEDATFALDIFLDEVQDRLKRRNLVLLIDEFEMLEEQVRQGRVDKEIFDYLRSLMQHRRGIHFLLAGTHTLEQFTSGYWSVFFNIARHSRLSKLSEEAAHKLITSPVEGSITYDPFAIEKIHHLTGDQPYLIQLICNVLVEHCNSCRKSYVTINDVNVVQEEVMETGHILLNWIREQSTTDERVVLSAVAQESGDDGHYVSLTDIEAIYRDNGLPYRKKEVLQVLHHLKQRDIIDISEGTRFRIPVGLTCRWLREAKPLQQVMLEENLLPS
ncbi:MAG: AAA family ATPase, partial [Chloroflexi bacterium]|nr:AAA family ATPase [Chloroflexota bacterium]